MKKFIAIFLLLQFLTCNAFAEELVKLPKLFIHYHHHAQEHNDTDGFTDFLVQHYSDKHQDKQHDDADDDDCDLPFKHCNDCCVGSHVPLIAFLPSFNEPLSNLVAISSEKHWMLNEKIENVCSVPVWQPPKFC